jgi:quercetin dioxygenase-like cupin family protein
MLAVDVVAGGAATGGAYSLVEVRATAGTTLPPHVALHDDLVVVLEGELEVQTWAGERVLAAGEQIALARRTPRRLRALSEVRVLVLSTPAGADTLAELVGRPAPVPDDLAALLAAAGVSLLRQSSLSRASTRSSPERTSS